MRAVAAALCCATRVRAARSRAAAARASLPHAVPLPGGFGSEVFSFWLEFGGVRAPPRIEVQVAAMFTKEHVDVGPAFSAALDALPAWVAPIAVISTYQTHVF